MLKNVIIFCALCKITVNIRNCAICGARRILMTFMLTGAAANVSNIINEVHMNLDEHKQETIEGMTYDFPYKLIVGTYAGVAGVEWHWHEEVELNYIIEGRIKVYTNSSTYEIHEGEAYLLNKNVMNAKYSIDTNTPVVEECNLFHPVFLCGHFHSIFETKYVNPVINNPDIEVAKFTNKTKNGARIINILKQLKDLEEVEGYEFKVRNLLSEAWILALQEIRDYEASLPKESAGVKNRMQHMVAYIQRHYSEKVTLDDIASAANISTREATRCFKKIRGKSPTEYLIDYRISVARRLLSDTEDSITDIAMKTGFTDSAYFGKIFRKYHDMTPVEYRRKSARIAKENI